MTDSFVFREVKISFLSMFPNPKIDAHLRYLATITVLSPAAINCYDLTSRAIGCKQLVLPATLQQVKD